MLESILRREPTVASVIGGVSELQREIETVLAGRRIASLDEYLEADRSGTGVRLGASDRRAIWGG